MQPPTACSMRKTMQELHARGDAAKASDPAENSSRPVMKILLRPVLSASDPMSMMKRLSTRKYASAIHCRSATPTRNG